MDNFIGRMINEYQLQERLGSGGQAVVYRASHFDPEVQHEVAIKIFAAEHAQNSDFIRRIKNEAMVVARLDNQNIVPLYSYHQETNGEICLFMRLMRGGSLSKQLREGPLTAEEAIVILTRIASALAAAHQERVIHGDVKPDNILFDQQHNAYLSDFGLAKQLKSSSNLLNASNDAGGTFGYIAPEQLLGAMPKPQADIFSLGITLYECFAGEHPPSDGWYQFENPQPEIVLPSLRDRRPELSDELDDVIRKATHRDPLERYDDVLKFLRDLTAALSHSLPSSVDLTRKKPPINISFSIGKVIQNQYKILAKPRVGGNSIVYRAFDTKSKREVVIKIIDTEEAQNPDFMRHFRHEALGVKTLTYVNIVSILNHWFGEDGSLYLVMPYLQGGSLSDRLRENGPLTVKEMAQILSQIAPAIAAAHQRGILHHDIRPANILFDSNDNAYMSDFGLPKQHNQSSNRIPSNGIGTPGYVAPEQFKDGTSEPQADIFSLGITLYECLTDQHPFSADLYKYIYQESEIKLPSLRTRRPDLPSDLDAIIRKATRRDPSQRYENVSTFAQVVSESLEKYSTLPTKSERKRPFGGFSLINPARRPKVFISYRRKSSLLIALVLFEKLQNHRIDAFVDGEKMDSVVGISFENTLFQQIEDCDVFVCLLAEGTLTSDWVKREIEYAHKINKPLIPVFQESFTRPESEMEVYVETLLSHHGVHAMDTKGVFINASVRELVKAINGFVPRRDIKWKLYAPAAILILLVIPVFVLANANNQYSREMELMQTETAQAIVLASLSPASPTVADNNTFIPTSTPLPSPVPSGTILTLDATATFTDEALTIPVNTWTPVPIVTPSPIPWGQTLKTISVFGTSLKVQVSIDNSEKPFIITYVPINNAQYRACVNRTDNASNRCQKPSSPIFETGNDHDPVVSITWIDAKKYCIYLRGHLPNAQEWDYAATNNENMGSQLQEWVNGDQPTLRGNGPVQGLGELGTSEKVGFRCVLNE